MTKAASTIELDDTVIEAVAARVATKITGYQRQGRYRWVEAATERLDPEDGAERLRCEIKTNLTVAERDAIKLSAETTLLEVWPVIAPYVRAWNVLDGDGQPVPAPMAAGPDAFRALTPEESTWLAFRIKLSNVENPELPKESTSSDATPSGGAGTS